MLIPLVPSLLSAFDLILLLLMFLLLFFSLLKLDLNLILLKIGKSFFLGVSIFDKCILNKILTSFSYGLKDIVYIF